MPRTRNSLWCGWVSSVSTYGCCSCRQSVEPVQLSRWERSWAQWCLCRLGSRGHARGSQKGWAGAAFVLGQHAGTSRDACRATGWEAGYLPSKGLPGRSACCAVSAVNQRQRPWWHCSPLPCFRRPSWPGRTAVCPSGQLPWGAAPSAEQPYCWAEEKKWKGSLINRFLNISGVNITYLKMNVSFTASEEWLAPVPGRGALPELQLQQRHRAVTVRGEGGHQPVVQPRSTLLPGTESPCPRSPSSPERGQSLPELSRGDARMTHGCQPSPSVVPAAAAVPDMNLRGARSAAVSSPPASSLGLSCGEF